MPKRRNDKEAGKFKQRKLSDVFKRADRNVVSDETTSDSCEKTCEPNKGETG